MYLRSLLMEVFPLQGCLMFEQLNAPLAADIPALREYWLARQVGMGFLLLENAWVWASRIITTQLILYKRSSTDIQESCANRSKISRREVQKQDDVQEWVLMLQRYEIMASLAGALVAFEAAAVRDLPAPLARVRFPELKGIDLGRMVADGAEPSLAFKAGLASVEMLVEYLELALEVVPFVAIVDVVQILEAEQVLLEAVVDLVLEHVVHELGVADRVVHQVDLPAQDQELVQLLVALDHGVVVADLDDGLLVVALDPFQSALGDVVAPQVELLPGLVGYLDAFLGRVVVAVPLAQVVAVVHVRPEDVEAFAEGLLALEAAALVAAWLRTAGVEEHLKLVAEFLVEQVLRVLEVPWFSLQIQLRGWLDWGCDYWLLRRVVYLWVIFGFGVDLLQGFLLLHEGFLLLELLQPLLLQLLLPYLLCLLRPEPLLRDLLLGLVDDRPQYLIDGHLEGELLLPDFHQVGLKLPDVDGLDLDLSVLEELELADIGFEGVLLLFRVDVEVGQVVDDQAEDFEEPAGLDEEREEDAYLFLCDFVDLIDDVGHFVKVPELLLELVPVAVDVSLLEAVLVLHALLEDLDEAAQQDAELLVLGLLAEGELVGERLRRLLVLLPQLGVEVQLVPLGLQPAIHHLINYKQTRPALVGRPNAKPAKRERGRGWLGLLVVLLCNKYFESPGMSHFRIQRKLTEGSSIRLRPNLSNPHRIRSLESKHSVSRSPKKIEQHELRRMIRRVSFKDRSTEKSEGKERMEEGIKAFREKNVGKALEIFRELRKNGDRSAELSYYLGSCSLNLGKHQSSIVFLNECLLQNEKFSQNAYLYIAINFKLLGNLRQAIRILEKGTAVFPAFEEGYFYMGKLMMRVGELAEAIEAFRKCLEINPINDLATIFLGDCLRTTGKHEKALENYRQVLLKGRRHRELAVGRVAVLLIQRRMEQQLLKELMELAARGFEHPEVSYFIGISCWNLGRKHDAIVYFESCLNNSKEAGVATRSLKALIRISVQESNFFQAEHHITRIHKIGLNIESFSEWILFVEGTNDLIKRKNQTALEKITKSLALCESRQDREKPNSLQLLSFRKNAYPYAAYALYLNNQMEKAIKMYEKALQTSQEQAKIKYAKLMAEGILLHSLQKYEEGFRKFQEAYQVDKCSEPLFLCCIALVQKYKTARQERALIFGRIEDMLKAQSCLASHSALFLFYSCLVLLFESKPCLPVIQEAIRCCEEPISQYYFIQALALHNEGKLSLALEAITKAIDLDPGIEQFYRERSKYYFLAEDYESAIQDCKRAEEMVPDDEELPLLLSFYYYLNDEFIKSYNYLLRTKPASGKLKEFEQALQLRLGMYDRLEEIGQLLIALKQQAEITEKLLLPLQAYIVQRYQYSEFSVYFYHLILAIGYASMREPQKALNHLFGCLEEIQFLVDQRESKKATYEVTWEETEEMLDEVKFNIVVVSLMKHNYEETEHFIEVFLNETESQDLKDSFTRILLLIKSEDLEGQVRLMAQDDYPRISDFFPNFKIPLKKQVLVTKLLISFPVKLKFTISPQFDPAYLLNFDIDKIQYKIPPPWLKTSTKKVNFTNSIRNESVLLSESQASERKNSKKSILPIRETLKLDSQVQQKLKKIMQK